MIWLLRNMDSLKAIPPEFNDEYFAKLFQQANFAAMSKTDQEEYVRAKLMAEIDRKSALRTAEEKGLAKGKAKGKAEEKLENAKSLKENGVMPELIAKSLGLTIEQVISL